MSRYDEIILAVEQALTGITRANGCRTDAGHHVYLRREFQLSPPDRPALILMPGDVSDSLDGDPAPSQGEENHLLPIEVEGYVDCLERGSEADDLRQDILEALKRDHLFGGLTDGYSGSWTSSIEISDGGEGGLLGIVSVRCTIFYVTTYGGG